MWIFPPLFSMSALAADESRLIERLKSRDAQAMADLYDRYKRLIYSIVYQAVREQGVAEDLTQETFWRIWNRIHTFDSEKGKLEPWIATIARNRAVDHLRSVRNSQQYSFETIETNAFFFSTQSHASRIEHENTIVKALNSLNPAQREVIELAHFQGLTQTEIAEVLNRPLGTVKGTLRSALKVLRGAMQGAHA
jgi:RNA polymerase sigma-70 factor (ECF subfamily)